MNNVLDYTKLSVLSYILRKLLKVIIKYTLVLHKYSFDQLLYMTAAHNQNKTLRNRIFFGTNIMVVQMYSRIHRTHCFPQFDDKYYSIILLILVWLLSMDRLYLILLLGKIFFPIGRGISGNINLAKSMQTSLHVEYKISNS